MHIDESWYRPDPKLPVRRVTGGVVCREERGHVLVALCGERKKSDFILPKGGIEAGETLEQAARREILEEAGFAKLQLLGELARIGRMNFRKTVWSDCTYFLFYTDEVDVTPHEHQRHIEPRWFPIDLLPPIFWPEQRKLLTDNVEKIIDLVLHRPR